MLSNFPSKYHEIKFPNLDDFIPDDSLTRENPQTRSILTTEKAAT